MMLSPYRRGADDGFIFGLYLSVMFFTSIYSAGLPVLSLLSLGMMVCVPVVIFVFMRRFEAALKEYATFPMLWMQGVVIFFCGTIIAGALLVVYMKWVEPDYVLKQLEGLAELGSTADGGFVAEAGEMAGKMIEANFIPSPIAIVTEIIMTSIVTGSLLSMAISGVMTLRRRVALRRFLDK